LIWLWHLEGPEAESKPPRPHPISFSWLNFGDDSIIEVAAEKNTHLNVEIPVDVLSRVQELVDSTTDPAKFAQATLGDRQVDGARLRAAFEAKRPLNAAESSPLFCPCKIVVAGTKPLPTADVKSAQK